MTKFHPGVMLTLGVVVGMIAILIVAGASAYTVDLVPDSFTMSPSSMRVNAANRFAFKVSNIGSSSGTSQASVAGLCIRDRSVPSDDDDCAGHVFGTPTKSGTFRQVFTKSISGVSGGGSSGEIVFNFTPNASDAGKVYDVAICADAGYEYDHTESNIDNNCYWAVQGLTVYQIDLVGVLLSYGPQTAKRVSGSVGTAIGVNVVGEFWIMKYDASTKFYGYVLNKGTELSSGTFYSRWCVDNESCNTTTACSTTVRTNCRIGNDVSITGDLLIPAAFPNDRRRIETTSAWTVPNDGKPHTVTFCADITNVVAENPDTNNCTTMNVYPVSADLYNTTPGTVASAIGANDSYGNQNYTGPTVGTLSPYRPLCVSGKCQ